MKIHLAVLVSGICFLSSAAGAMTIDEFVTRADALKGQGMMAMLSGDEVKTLRAEVQAAAGAYRTDVDAAQARKDKSLGCPPGKGKARIGAEDLVESFRAIPEPRRKAMTVKAGLYDFMKSRYPCT